MSKMPVMETGNAAKFMCDVCYYYTDHKSHYDKHITTRKHIERKQMETKNADAPVSADKNYSCNNCNKIYSNRSGLWKHNKKCIYKGVMQTMIEQQQTIMNELVEVKKQNAELKQMFETQNQIISSNNHNIPANTITGDNNNVQNNIQNNFFNTQVFLETECKNAINMKDFLDNINIDINELDFIKDNNHIKAISDIFIKNLNKYDIHHRPLHCTDIKRLTIYVKDEDEWTTKDKGTDKFTKAIGDIQKIATQSLPLYEEYYKHIMNDEELFENYNIIVNKTTRQLNGKDNEKIMKNIASNVKIGKESECKGNQGKGSEAPF
jgi:hypothetical protein